MPGGEQPSDSTAPVAALRASDAEREHTATLLREHCAAGRLTPEELDERLDAAYAARTVGELDALVHDLPADAGPAATAARRPSRSAERAAAQSRLLHAIGLSVLVSAAAVAIWVATGAGGSFWPKWIVLVSAIRIAFAAWGELGPAAGSRGRDESRLGRGGVRPRDPLAPPPPPPLPREHGDER